MSFYKHDSDAVNSEQHDAKSFDLNFSLSDDTIVFPSFEPDCNEVVVGPGFKQKPILRLVVSNANALPKGPPSSKE